MRCMKRCWNGAWKHKLDYMHDTSVPHLWTWIWGTGKIDFMNQQYKKGKQYVCPQKQGFVSRRVFAFSVHHWCDLKLHSIPKAEQFFSESEVRNQGGSVFTIDLIGNGMEFYVTSVGGWISPEEFCQFHRVPKNIKTWHASRAGKMMSYSMKKSWKSRVSDFRASDNQ